MRKLHLVVMPLLVGLAACGSEDPQSPTEFYKGGTVEPGEPSDTPTFSPIAYPAGPYGVEKGSVVANYSLLGWHEPAMRGYDVNQLEKVSFADFYNPDGSGEYKFIFLNSSARWCSVCKAEFGKMKVEGTWGQYKPKGVLFISSLFEDASNPPKPAAPNDLNLWGSAYAIEFPMMLDPGFKFGQFFTADATPMNLIINTRTMVIEEKILGGDLPSVLNKIDQLLAQ